MTPLLFAPQFADRLCVIFRAKNPGAGDEYVCAVFDRYSCSLGVDAAVYFDVDRAVQRSCTFNFLHLISSKGLPPKPGCTVITSSMSILSRKGTTKSNEVSGFR